MKNKYGRIDVREVCEGRIYGKCGHRARSNRLALGNPDIDYAYENIFPMKFMFPMKCIFPMKCNPTSDFTVTRERQLAVRIFEVKIV
jgi:hypothetical protein